MKIKFEPVGIVRNGISKRHDMPYAGVDSKILIYPRFIKALKSININSRIWVITYLHRAKRNVLQARRRKKIPLDKIYRGVFSVHSPDRPNPIAISRVRLISARKGVLAVKGLDVIDGTPVLDLKSA